MPVSETSQIESFFSDIAKILMEFNSQMFSGSCIYADGKITSHLLLNYVRVVWSLYVQL